MTRFSQPANQAVFEQEHVDYGIAVALDFLSGMVRAHMGVGNLVFNGNTYQGVGTAGSGGFGGLSAVVEKPDARDTSELYLLLSGIDPFLLSEVPQRAEYYGRFASIFFIPVDSTTMKPLGPAEPAIFEGFMDQLAYSRKQASASIQLTVKHYDSLFQNTIGLLYTDESQKSLFSTDNFFDQVSSLANKKVQWGGTTVDPANPDLSGGRRGRDPGGKH